MYNAVFSIRKYGSVYCICNWHLFRSHYTEKDRFRQKPVFFNEIHPCGWVKYAFRRVKFALRQVKSLRRWVDFISPKAQAFDFTCNADFTVRIMLFCEKADKPTAERTVYNTQSFFIYNRASTQALEQDCRIPLSACPRQTPSSYKTFSRLSLRELLPDTS